MSATPAQRELLEVLDELALLTGIEQDLRDVATRIANRARTLNEADDVRLLIVCRTKVAAYKAQVARRHPDSRPGVTQT